ncbi:hypothetical protein [Undibacterium sp. Di26W]|uniref:hypothetical protein n=1 Tax=Undibacterium sp. Di26W TaxID=3413035 RepID=UPI003BF52109
MADDIVWVALHSPDKCNAKRHTLNPGIIDGNEKQFLKLADKHSQNTKRKKR